MNHQPDPLWPAPGHDQIAVAVPDGRLLCNSREHRVQGRLAEVMVTFGELGTRYQDALWAECWGRTYPMCGPCWDRTRTIAQARRPGLVIHGTRQPDPPSAPVAGR